MHLLLWLIFRQSHPNFINVRTAYASEIWAQLTKNLLTKSSTKRFREYILDDQRLGDKEYKSGRALKIEVMSLFLCGVTVSILDF